MHCVVRNRAKYRQILTSFSSSDQAKLSLICIREHVLARKHRVETHEYSPARVLKTFVRSFDKIQSCSLPMITVVGPPTKLESAAFWVVFEVFAVLDHFGKRGATL